MSSTLSFVLQRHLLNGRWVKHYQSGAIRYATAEEAELWEEMERVQALGEEVQRVLAEVRAQVQDLGQQVEAMKGEVGRLAQERNELALQLRALEQAPAPGPTPTRKRG